VFKEFSYLTTKSGYIQTMLVILARRGYVPKNT